MADSRPMKPKPRKPAARPSSAPAERDREAPAQRGPVGTPSQRPLAVEPSARLPAVTLRAAVRQPLIYRKRVAEFGGARPGDLVSVYAADELIGYGLFNPRSEIAVRMVSFGAQLPDEPFWEARLRRAVALRRELLRLDEQTNAYRVIHAEADGFSGLVVDRLGDVLSAEAFSLGMYQRGADLLQRLAPLCGARHLVLRASPQFLSQEGVDAPLWQSPDGPRQTIITEYGTRFRVLPGEGHKTGFFCDQRENRRRLADFCRDRRVLDLCCYTGGFAIQAKRLGQAREATGVDLDEEPLQLARENANLNQVRVRFVQADVFGYMREMIAQGRRYDVVVLDPPKLIRTRAEYDEGVRKHFDLNRLAMRLVEDGGLLLTCSCSGLLGEEAFAELLRSAARQAGDELPGETPAGRRRHGPRAMQILARTQAAPDHPVAADVPETDYLKAFWLRLTD